MSKKELGTTIKELRQKHQMTQQQLADLVGVSNKAVSKWENNEGLPDLDNLKRLSQVFNVTLDNMLHNNIQTPVYLRVTSDWISICISAATIILFFFPLIKLDIVNLFASGLGIGTIGDISINADFSSFEVIAQAFSSFDFGNFVTGLSLLVLLVVSLIQMVQTYRIGITKTHESNMFLILEGVAFIILLVALLLLIIVANYYTLTPVVFIMGLLVIINVFVVKKQRDSERFILSKKY